MPTEPEGYPETFSHDSTPQVLRVGKGVFSPVSDAVWQFSVSGLQVVQSWLKYRMKHGAGRSSSPLDEIRPTCWTAEMTKELLEMLWVLEATVTMFPNLRAVFGEIIGGETFCADEIPQPTSEEKRAPIGEEDQSTQVEIDLWNTANAP